MSVIFDGRINSGARFPTAGGNVGQYTSGSGPVSGIDYVQDPLGQRGLVARMTCRAGQALWNNGWRAAATCISSPYGVRVYHRSVLLAADWDGDWPYTIVLQNHGNDSTAQWGRPPCFEMSCCGPAHRCFVRMWSRTDPRANPPDISGVVQRLLWSGYLDLTKWLDVTINVNWQYDSTGWFELYIDGKMVAGFTGAGTAFNEPEGGPFCTFESYVQNPHDRTPVRDVSTHHSGVLIATTLADVTAATGVLFRKASNFLT